MAKLLLGAPAVQLIKWSQSRFPGLLRAAWSTAVPSCCRRARASPSARSPARKEPPHDDGTSSPSRTFASASAPSGRSAACRWRSRPASASRCSATTAPASRPSSKPCSASSRPKAAAIVVDGHRPGSGTASRAVSYLPRSRRLPKTLTGREILSTFARLQGRGSGQALGLLDLVGIAAAATPGRHLLHKGHAPAPRFAQALIGRPACFCSTSRPAASTALRRDFYAIVAAAAERGTAVLISSHSLSEVESKTDAS